MIIIGSDHRGYQMKEHIKTILMGEDVAPILDAGTHGLESVHYPEVAQIVCEVMLDQHKPHYGILICGSGIGIAMAANRYGRIRAATCRTATDAKMTRRHNDANVLCIGADATKFKHVEDIVLTFLRTEFEGGRHQTRVDMLGAI